MLAWLLLALVASPIEQHRTAEALYQAGEYEQAATAFEEILNSDIRGAKKRRVEYNVAMAKLAAQEFTAAIDHFNHLSQASDFPIPLKRTLYLSLAQAYVGSARQAVGDDENFLQGCQKSLGALDGALRACRQAVEAEQEAALLEGDEYDEVSAELVQLRQVIKQEVASLLEQKRLYELSHLPYEQALQTLLGRIGWTKQRTEAIVSAKDSPGHPLAQIAKSQRKLEPIWGALNRAAKEQFETALAKAEEERGGPFANRQEACEHPLVKQALWHEQEANEAYGQFQMGLDRLQRGDGETAYSDLVISSLDLNLLLWEAQSQDPLQQLFEQRIALEKQLQSSQFEPLKVADAHHLALAQQLCEARQGVNEGLTARLLQRLCERLATDEGTPAQHLLYYNEIDRDEGKTLAELYAAVAGKKGESVAERIGVLTEKFQVRSEFEENEKLPELIATLDRAGMLASVGEDDELLMLLDSALHMWSLTGWLGVRMEEWQDTCAQLLGSPRLNTKVLDGLKENQAEVLFEVHAEDHELATGPVGISIANAIDDLSSAQDSHRVRHPLATSIALEDASRWLFRGVKELDSSVQPTPENILKAGIEEQEYAVGLTEKGEAAAHNDQMTERVQKIITRSQEVVLKAVAGFHESLSTLEEPLPKEVVTLFNEGHKEARQAKKHLSAARPEWLQAIGSQNLAIEKWKEALELLKEPNSDDGDQEGNDQQEGDSTSSEQDQQTAAASPQEIFELLQEMDRDDAPKSDHQVPARRGVRPW